MTDSSANDYVVETDDLSLNFNHKQALDRLTLRVARGGIHALVGANGAGKSSLFRILLGFESASSGSARILGCASDRLSPALRRRIGFVNEEHTLPPWMRVDQLTAMQRRLYPDWDEACYRAVLNNFSVLPQQGISQLSRGERAGVSLALALGQRPELLILDEPTLGLDVVAKRLFLTAMMDSSYSGGATVIYCSHQMDEIERVADQLIIMERGQLVHASSPTEFCERVLLWVIEFPFRAPDTSQLPGVLQTELIDGLTHLIVYDQGENFDMQLRLLGARTARCIPVSLERAVNGLLAHRHISSTDTFSHVHAA